MMKRYLWLCLILAGCSSSAGQQFSTDAAKQIHAGTSKSAVENLLGPPLSRNMVKGEETWQYTYFASNNSYSPTTFIPYVNMVAGGVATTTASKTISIRFRGESVASCTINISSQNTSTSGGLMTGYHQDGGQAQTFENDCDKQ